MDAYEIEQVASMYGSPVSKRRKDIHINCPFGSYHSKGIDTSQGLSVLIAPGARSVAYCFSCRSQGTLAFVFEEASKLDPSYLPVYQFILERDGPSLAGALARLREDGLEGAQETPATDWGVYASRCARQVPAYLISRGIIRPDVRKWMLGYDTELQRAIFPVRDIDGRVVGCLRRALHEGQDPKYKDTPGAYVWKRSVFYGEHLVDPTLGTVIVVEGPMGTIFSSRLFANVLGMMGADTGMGEDRLRKLRDWGVHTIVLMLDSDEKGFSAVYGKQRPDGTWTDGLRDILRREWIVKVAKLPPKEDPDDVVRRDPTALRQIVNSAAYLEPSPKDYLTGGSEGATVTPPRRGRPGIIDYLSRGERHLREPEGAE